ncbi:uncharacterized protein LY79DRAFT_22572 [Colletotrichum navitas]|uniref:Uncharacterized protein n=1 Tax=Colletotrichum navitas TaxID=681940 RepID=A0AAD8QDP6_9PEZI|nr:uncharacterized protein LY79DRAFT_22572 [Colletotrichum navitas]KAK1600520.1 hypothetical protein LY79DRAFT_22572 [Colletotrichum navitas]
MFGHVLGSLGMLLSHRHGWIPTLIELSGLVEPEESDFRGKGFTSAVLRANKPMLPGPGLGVKAVGRQATYLVQGKLKWRVTACKMWINGNECTKPRILPIWVRIGSLHTDTPYASGSCGCGVGATLNRRGVIVAPFPRRGVAMDGDSVASLADLWGQGKAISRRAARRILPPTFASATQPVTAAGLVHPDRHTHQADRRGVVMSNQSLSKNLAVAAP